MRRSIIGVLSAVLVVSGAVGTGCESAPGDRKTQSTVIGGAAGAAAGALIGGEGNRLLGALIGGAIGAGGGYLIGAKTDWFEDDEDHAEAAAREAVLDAQRSPATVEDVNNSITADLDQDGFVTMDEVTAMERAGLSDDEMLERLRATEQVFDLSPSQRDQLLRAGVSRRVVAELPEINRKQRDQILARP